LTCSSMRELTKPSMRKLIKPENYTDETNKLNILRSVSDGVF
jgi:hypothetical protein